MKSAPSVRLLPFAVADGPAHMAADETLLESAAAGRASLRFYGWTEPTLSLGYFQPAAVRSHAPLLAGLPFVRRPSGGATLVHHHEVTYALAVPPGWPWQDRSSWLCRMHGAITTALAQLGVGVSGVTCGAETKLGEVLCFLHHTPGDLTVSGHKVVGSAQRKSRGALMQHGAILLAQSPHTPSLPGLRELTGVTLTPEDVADAVRDAFAADTGWTVYTDDWTTAERVRAAELAGSRYRSADWNDRR